MKTAKKVTFSYQSIFYLTLFLLACGFINENIQAKEKYDKDQCYGYSIALIKWTFWILFIFGFVAIFVRVFVIL